MSENWTTLKLISWTTGYFQKKEIPNPRLDSELLLAHTLKCKRIDLYTRHEKKISQKDLGKFKELIERRATREPLQYIVGETEFWGLKIGVTPAVLIPRPETELLVEEALKTLPKASRILEIGTGSGCIAIALTKALPSADTVATEFSKEALRIARENTSLHGVEKRIRFILADGGPWERFEAEGRRFDLIVSNPPYIPTGDFPTLQPEVRDFEPRLALDGGPDGLVFIRRILEEATPFLRPDGLLLIEIGEGQALRLEKLLQETGRLRLKKVRKDYSGTDRIACLSRSNLLQK